MTKKAIKEKRKKRKKTISRPKKRSRKNEKTMTVKKKGKKTRSRPRKRPRKNFLFVDRFLGRERVFFLFFLLNKFPPQKNNISN